jgi:hypothetical protein
MLIIPVKMAIDSELLIQAELDDGMQPVLA